MDLDARRIDEALGLCHILLTKSDRVEKELAELWLQEIAPKELDPQQRWWTFPAQGQVRGFFGGRPLMLIGDQPSTDPWPEWHRSRVLLYGVLIRLGIADAHLTDVIKRRGKGSESCRKGLPSDFPTHLAVLRREIAILQPRRIVALGFCAEQLLLTYLSEYKKVIRGVWHFSYGARDASKAEGFEAQLEAAIL